jgi:hypothetical protein
MTTCRLLLVGGFGVCMLAPDRRSDAQRVVYYTYFTNGTDMTACRGFTSVHRAKWVYDDRKKDSLNVSYPVVADLDPLSPAGRGGLANGDSLVRINSYTTLGANDPELGMWNLEIGASNTLRVKRGETAMAVSFAMGEWVTQRSADGAAGGPTQRVCRPAK